MGLPSRVVLLLLDPMVHKLHLQWRRDGGVALRRGTHLVVHFLILLRGVVVHGAHRHTAAAQGGRRHEAVEHWREVGEAETC